MWDYEKSSPSRTYVVIGRYKTVDNAVKDVGYYGYRFVIHEHTENNAREAFHHSGDIFPDIWPELCFPAEEWLGIKF